jgi:hypothetical protein
MRNFLGSVIKPTQVTPEYLLWDFGLNNLIEMPKGPKPRLLKDEDPGLNSGFRL